jgi:hypothetical protein
VLKAGFGLLLKGPRNFIWAAAELLAARGLGVQVLAGAKPHGTFKVLQVGRNFVVAEDFEFEPAEPPA